MYKLRISPKAGKGLKRLKIDHQKAVLEALGEISEDPFIGKPLTRELTGRFSLRVGVYRIIYTVDKTDGIITVITAGHRSVVYN
ncbi:MAG: type II toxin-antitoxin system RelE/ParE family toxin [Patescibacteria group bacterium]